MVVMGLFHNDGLKTSLIKEYLSRDLKELGG